MREGSKKDGKRVLGRDVEGKIREESVVRGCRNLGREAEYASSR